MADQSSDSILENRTMELSTFYLGKALCGMDILKIQEINKDIKMTEVPQSPDYVMGILNLRGQIVTTIDLGKKLGLSSSELDDNSRNIIVNSKDEYIGLLVDSIGDVIKAEKSKIEQAPANVGEMQGKYFDGVYKLEDNLVGILNLEEVLNIEE